MLILKTPHNEVSPSAVASEMKLLQLNWMTDSF